MKLDTAQREEARQIASELAQIARSADVLTGTITERLPLRQAGCACHGDPPRRHGPYWQWTRKVQGKTVGGYLNKKEAREYQLWIDNDRRIRELAGAPRDDRDRLN